MTLATLTDYQRADLLRAICRIYDVNYTAIDADELLSWIERDADQAWSYRDLSD